MAELDFLDAKHRIYALHREAWLREERRIFGGDAVLEEVVQFTGESDASFAARKKQATYVNFPKAHASVVTGQLRLHAPTPDNGLSFGTLGMIRTRNQVGNQPTMAELLYYNVDGIGSDGSEFPGWYDAVDERAQATGHRWLMMETPPRAESGLASADEVRRGFRPYVVEYSPLEVTNWFFRAGQLQFAVIRVPAGEPTVENGQFKAVSSATQDPQGYYLLVRQGYTGLGPAFEQGGWWLYDHEKKPVGTPSDGRWTNTRGEIPLWIHYGEKSTGTTERPALSRSSTMELGQIAVSLMNTISARDYDAWDAAASRLYFLGADSDVMKDVATQVAARSMMIGVPVAASLAGNTDNRVQVYDGSMGAVAAEVFATIIEAKFTEAKEQSFQQITSSPESSGISKEAGHQQEKAPYLARRAALRQASENSFIYFAELRAGATEPSGSSVYERKFDLTPTVDKIRAVAEVLRMLPGVRSPTLETHLGYTVAADRNLIPNGEDKKIKAEMLDAVLEAKERAEQMRALLEGGGDEEPTRATREPVREPAAAGNGREP